MENNINTSDNNKNSSLPVYFAKKDAKECVEVLNGKISDWVNGFRRNGYLNKVRTCWEFYHGMFSGESFDEAHQIQFEGEQGELLRLNINNFRNIAKNIISMTTSSRPKVETRAVNGDYKSLVQSRLASGLIDYYMREKNLEQMIRDATEYAVVLGTGYIKIDWDETQGDLIAYNEETKTEIYDGDLVFTKLSPYDVVFDPNCDDWNKNDWLIVRTPKNRFDLAAKYPDLEQEILNVPTLSDEKALALDGRNLSNTDLVYVYEFIHKRTNAMPDGRYIIFCDSRTVMVDAPMPYRVMNVYRITPGTILGSPYGYTDMFDQIPIQEAFNSLSSSIFTNLSAFATQLVAVPEDSGITVTQLSEGMTFLKYAGDKGPEGINLTKIAPETFTFMDSLNKYSETNSGMNSVVRGSPDANLRSGSSLALVQAQAVQYLSGLQQQYAKLIEDVATGCIRILQDFAKTPRMAAIVGESQKSKLKEFTGEDINAINRVVCNVSNPIQDTLAGKLSIADTLMQYQAINGQQYMNILATGELSGTTGPIADVNELMRQENEMLQEGKLPLVILTDDHLLHIETHKQVLNNPYARFEPEIVKTTLAHIQMHIDELKNTPPEDLAAMGQQSLAPPQGAPAPAGADMEGPAPEQPPVGGGPAGATGSPVQQGEGMSVSGGEISGGGLPNNINIPQG